MAQSCGAAKLSVAAGECLDFCKGVEDLSKERLATILSVRSWHIFGKFAAQMFDGVRGVDQGEERINKLFEAKTCAKVLQSVDKSNLMVNGICWLTAVACGMVMMTFGIAAVFGVQGPTPVASPLP